MTQPKSGTPARPARLGGEGGTARHWRSLERRAEDASGGAATLPERVRPEFAPGADLPPDAVTRRTVLGLMGAALGLAGTTACRRPVEEIVPYVVAPEEVVPGIPRHYATALALGGSVLGVLVESHEGRPTKVEGNPDHPASGGAASAWAQASILDLYDPDRLRTVIRRTTDGGAPAAASWADFAAWWQEHGERLAGEGGRGLWVVSGASTSPTLERLAGELASRFPAARWVVHEPAGDQAIHDGIEGATGAAGAPLYDLSRARRILALDADLLHTENGAVAHARALAAARRAGAEAGSEAALRLYVVEPVPTSTGAVADHRLALPAGQVAAFAAAVAAELGAGGDAPGGELPEPMRRRAALIAADLASAPGAAMVVAGRRQPPEVHALVHAMNQRLGAPVAVRPVPRLATVARAADGGRDDLAALATALAAREVDTLVVLGGDPAYSAPGDLGLASLLAAAPHRVVLAHDENLTSEGGEWVLPMAHPFEAWGDVRSADGTLSVVQPVIEPLLGGRSDVELVGLLASGEERPGYELVRRTWQDGGLAGGDFEGGWRRALHAGVVNGVGAAATGAPGTAVRPAGQPLDDGEGPQGDPGAARDEEGAGAAAALAAGPATAPGEERESVGRAADPPAAPVETNDAAATGFAAPPWRDLEIVFQVSSSVFDGRFASNAWLQELPDPMTKLVWGNAALIAPTTAAELGVVDGDELLLNVGGRKLLAPVAVQPGQAEGTIALALGYGRTAVGRAGREVGVDAYRLRSAASPWIDRVAVERTGRRHELTRTQEHWEIEGRNLARSIVAGGGAANGHAAEAPGDHAAGDSAAGDHAVDDHAVDDHAVDADDPYRAARLWDPPALTGEYQWGMAIDLSSCVGCNACITACQAENNIPVVGAEQVSNGREMHWLRLDRYYSGTPEEPDFGFLPVPCMHCENAPCEQVCPVAATVHDAEGLNGMTYNRCIGTRYCSNNCPYKVRRFNFFNYTVETPEILKLAMNPDVTVRSRGVMEKCTYCLQRINQGKRQAKLAGRKVADGEIRTACQQTCPADAIVFGDVSDPASRVSAAKRDARNYTLLDHLNNRPRTSYLARVVNPHPQWEERA